VADFKAISARNRMSIAYFGLKFIAWKSPYFVVNKKNGKKKSPVKTGLTITLTMKFLYVIA
tara:strand:- start:41644 stop:41826 length:183 start_codon:yes stop_codon:yes gene_type:complete